MKTSKTRKRFEQLIDKGFVQSGIMACLPLGSSIARLLQGYIDDQIRFDADIANLMAATGKTRDELMEAYHSFPGDWYQFCHMVLAASFSADDLLSLDIRLEDE